MTQIMSESIRAQVQELFAGLVHPLVILYFGSTSEERCEYCAQTLQMLEEIGGLSDLITLRAYDIDADAALAKQYNVTDAPGIVLAALDGEKITDYGIRYKGVPAGHEFASLVNDLVLVSRRASSLSPQTLAFLKELKQPVHLQVFVTPTCPHCPRAVVLAHQFALESEFVQAEMVEALEFPGLSDRFNVSGVPQTTINWGAGTLVGAAPEDMLVEEIRKAIQK